MNAIKPSSSLLCSVLGKRTTDPRKLLPQSHSPIPYFWPGPLSVLSCLVMSIAFPVPLAIYSFPSIVAPILSDVSPTLTLLIVFDMLCRGSAKISISNRVHEVLHCLLNFTVSTHVVANCLSLGAAQMILFIFAAAAGMFP